MARGLSSRLRAAALIAAANGAAIVAVPAQAQVRADSPTDALARNVKLLGTSPRNFEALIGAGRAALALGDTQAAAGFFGRAEEVWPASALPQAGMGAALALDGEARGALQYFARATQRGATLSMIGADRGLAYDLLGQHAQAQSDYRAALIGRDGDEARRRLALSLAITGKKAEALSLLSPLMARRDPAAPRIRALVLAVSGDATGARSAIEVAMPGSSSSMDYFFRRLPALRSDQKAAAVHLGIFPGVGTQMASATSVPPVYSAPSAVADSARDDRIGSIERWLAERKPQPAPSASQSAQLASVSLPPRITGTAPARADFSAPAGRARLWLQLASGPNATALPEQFQRMKSRNRELFEGISGYVVDDAGRSRLLIGPFRSSDEASIFAEDLETVHINAFTWTSQPGQMVRKLPAE